MFDKNEATKLGAAMIVVMGAIAIIFALLARSFWPITTMVSGVIGAIAVVAKYDKVLVVIDKFFKKD